MTWRVQTRISPAKQVSHQNIQEEDESTNHKFPSSLHLSSQVHFTLTVPVFKKKRKRPLTNTVFPTSKESKIEMRAPLIPNRFFFPNGFPRDVVSQKRTIQTPTVERRYEVNSPLLLEEKANNSNALVQPLSLPNRSHRKSTMLGDPNMDDLTFWSPTATTNGMKWKYILYHPHFSHFPHFLPKNICSRRRKGRKKGRMSVEVRENGRFGGRYTFPLTTQQTWTHKRMSSLSATTFQLFSFSRQRTSNRPSDVL